MNYKTIYSKRKTVGIIIRGGNVIVRSPYGIKRKELDKIVEKHKGWILKKLDEDIRRREERPHFTEDDIPGLIKDAREYFGVLVPSVASKMGLKYNRLTITRAMHRFGSCSSNGNICLSFRLMLYPKEARLYVVVHELAHLVYLNHSRDFYKLIAMYLPEYKKYEALLK